MLARHSRSRRSAAAIALTPLAVRAGADRDEARQRHHQRRAARVAEGVRRRTARTRVGGKVKTEIYPASQLGAIPRMVEGVSARHDRVLHDADLVHDRLDPRFQHLRRARPVRLARARPCGDPRSRPIAIISRPCSSTGPPRDRGDLQQPDRRADQEAVADARRPARASRSAPSRRRCRWSR